MGTRTVFLDNWVLERLLGDQRVRQILLPSTGSEFRGVVSLWHLYEIASDGDKDRARSKAALLDDMAPLWMKTHAHFKREVLQEHLWLYLRAKPRVEAVEAFSETLREASEFMAGGPSPVPLTALMQIEYLTRYPELLEGPRKAVADWAKATSIIMGRKEESLERQDEVARILIRKQLPTHTPDGLEIPAKEVDGFVAQLDWKSVPLLAVEGALYAAELTWHGRLDEGDAVDIQYLSVALVCCDVVVVDKRMAELTRRASAGLRFGLAKVLKDPRQLLNL